MKEKDLFDIGNIINAPLQKGTLLISPPLMADGIFHKSVILLLEHNEEGSLGLILNKPSNLKSSEVFKEIPDFHKDMFLGGPVSPGQALALHRLSTVQGCIHIINDTYWGGKFDDIFELINLGHLNQNEVTFFLGYAGWAPEQLDSEIEKDFWITLPGENYDLWNHPENLWEDIITGLGLNPKIAENIPSDPSLN